MTERLYYKDSSVLEFEAKITASGNDGEMYYTVLDRSAFYPTSGGQLNDTGTLSDVEIVDVVEHDEDDIRHLSTRPVGEVGDAVHGQVDPVRRHRHMQQHTAQHILSQAFFKHLNLATVSVHLGEEYGAIEFDTDELTSEQLARIERAASDMIFDNIPIEILFLDSSEAESVPFRRPPKRSGKLRVIRIGDEEYSACGGTHCRSTAEVGMVKVIGTEKIRGRVLVKFLSGVQILDDYGVRFDVTDRLSQAMTCHVNDLPERFERLQTEAKRLKREISRLNKEALPAKAGEVAAKSETSGSVKIVIEELSDYDAKLAGQLGGVVADLIGGLAVLYLDGRLIVTAGEGSGLDAGKLARELSEQADLKGGGNNRQAHLGNAEKSKLGDYRKILLGLIG